MKRGNAAHIYDRERRDGTIAHRVMFRIDGAQVGETFDSRTAAEEFAGWVRSYGGSEARKLRDARAGHQGAATPTVTEWCRTYVKSRSGITVGTVRDYEKIISGHIEPKPIGALPVDVIDEDHIAAWLRGQEQAGASGKSMRNRHGLLSAALNYAVRKKLRGDNPCEESRISETAKAAMTFLSHGEFAVLLAAMPSRWKPLTVTLAGTGMRFGEATALHVTNVHLDDDMPSVRVEQAWKWTDGSDDLLGPPKSAKGRRTISLPPEVVSVLRPLIDGKKSGDLVFTRAEGGRVRNVDYREDGWVRALKRASLTKRPRIHDLRHSHVAWLLSAGVPLPVVQARLGHESIRTTVDTYGHLLPDTQRAAADASSIALGQALPEIGPPA